jgi:pyruvate dehydrogenase E1 component
VPVVVVTDYVTALPDQIARFVGAPVTATSGSGYGCSDTHDARRAHFSTDAAGISLAAVALLADTGLVAPEIAG